MSASRWHAHAARDYRAPDSAKGRDGAARCAAAVAPEHPHRITLSKPATTMQNGIDVPGRDSARLPREPVAEETAISSDVAVHRPKSADHLLLASSNARTWLDPSGSARSSAHGAVGAGEGGESILVTPHRQRGVVLGQWASEQREANHTVGARQLLADRAGARNSRHVDRRLRGGMLDASTRYSRSGSSDEVHFHGDFMIDPSRSDELCSAESTVSIARHRRWPATANLKPPAERPDRRRRGEPRRCTDRCPCGGGPPGCGVGWLVAA